MDYLPAVKDYTFIAERAGLPNPGKVKKAFSSDPFMLLGFLEQNKVFDFLLGGKNASVKDSGRIHPYFIMLAAASRYLKQSGISDTKLILYVGEMLTKFSDSKVWREIPLELGENNNPKVDHVSDFIYAVETQTSREEDSNARFRVCKKAGDFALFMSGVFADRIIYRSSLGKPTATLETFDWWGTYSFSKALEYAAANHPPMSKLSRKEFFKPTREALHELAGRHLLFDDLEKMIMRMFSNPSDRKAQVLYRFLMGNEETRGTDYRRVVRKRIPRKRLRES